MSQRETPEARRARYLREVQHYDKSVWPWRWRKVARKPRPQRDVPTPFEIRALREKLGMTLEQMSRTMVVSQGTAGNWEGGRMRMFERCIPVFRKMQVLADHLLARRAKPDFDL